MLKISMAAKAFNGHQIFEDLSLKFQPGKIYAISGASGAGKSTLLNCIATLESLDSGTIHFRDQNISDINNRRYLRDYLGYLFQNYALIDDETVKANLVITKKYGLEQLELALKQFGLDESYLNRKVFTLSGGECQRVALARMLLKDPPIILADEPTGALDAENENMVLDSLRNFAQMGKVVIVTTHSQSVLAKSDEVVHLS
ncbi:ATP-binding cassette domain-containing protein [Levilactobacillus angrenensis]|uniref:ATP-binding cassette domain-containing protein n=1 Tax=Levilactobacillus angrenensis TaxID=2486020 RepID=A0ABW1U8W5_9LACO|nr:ATP-binding cassette domain-containing protein [Levilactobacillus angrenensis]